MEENDVQLQLKKRARRRLVGAVAFVSVAAVVLPVIMDQEPRQPVQDVEIRIPGQDDKAFAPKFAVMPVDKPAAAARPRPEPSPVLDARGGSASETPNARVLETTRDEASRPEKPADKASDKAVAKPADKAEAKPAEKTADKPVRTEDAKRAAAILDGKPAAPVKAGEHLILIGAFANEANVRILKEKLTQEGIRVFTEPLETPQGKKTRVRAGPFPTREAAEKALAKMQKIGVSGVISAKS